MGCNEYIVTVKLAESAEEKKRNEFFFGVFLLVVGYFVKT